MFRLLLLDLSPSSTRYSFGHFVFFAPLLLCFCLLCSMSSVVVDLVAVLVDSFAVICLVVVFYWLVEDLVGQSGW
jgi:hypothetical protein